MLQLQEVILLQQEPKKEALDVDKAEDKKAELRTNFYETKLEARNAFKALLDNANVGSDRTWEQVNILLCTIQCLKS